MKLKAVPQLSYSKVIWEALVVFVFLTCCAVTQQADVKSNAKCRTQEDVIQNPADGICGSVNIRNSVSKLRKLENCTVIEGDVHISLIDRSSAEEFEMYSFPLLKEITGHLMLFRVRNLRSLRTLFPSLAIIRGQTLFYNYGLVAYEMQDLEEIGLINLRTIIRGGVRITKNKKLCHVDTIDWSRIAIGADPSEHHFMDNKEERRCANYCPDKCPSTVVDGVRAKRCWTSQHCQKNLNCNCNDNRPCMDNGTCCHKFCLGGCTGPLPSDCLGCKGVVFKKTCQPRCPLYTYKFFETRCLLDKECIAVRGSGSKVLKAIEQGEQNQCVTGDCPPGYMVAEEGEYRGKECVKCKDFCPRVCNSTEVNSIQDLQRLKGCSKIIGPLIIQIMGGKSVAEEMEKNLGEIREVTGFINIRRSFALLHLYFFKKLEIIGGETLAHQRHSLIVMDNANLQELFPKGHKIKIKRGQVAFHTNRRLCIYKIEEFVATLNLTDPPGDQDISQHTNGDLKVCSPEQMSLNVTQITHESALLVWEKDLKDTRHLLTYNINYKEVSTDDDNVNIYLGRDACYDEVWLNKEQQPTADNENFQMGLLPNLKPFTKYAVYVQALTLTTSTASAMTDIVTFSTSTYYPSEPLKLEVTATDDPTELHIKWKPPKYPNGLVTYYKLVYIKQPLDIEAFDRRNYCHHPLVEPKVKSKSKLEEEQKKRNMSGNCCDCLKSQKEEDKDRDKRQMEVYFENHLQNNIYCKRFDTLPNVVVIDASMTEQWHNMNKEGLAKGGRGNKLMSAMKANKTVTASLDTNLASAAAAAAAKEKMKYSQAYNIMELDIYNFTETVINNLEPFMEYVIELQACQDTSPSKGGLCSNSRAIASGRTQALPIKDKVNESSIVVEHVTNVTGDVIISWAAPPKPNGLILKYNLKYKRASQDNLVAQDICINRKMYKEMPGYRLSTLEPGNWTFQIFALSLTGKYSETRERYFIVDQLPDKTDNNKLYVAVAVIAFLVITLIGLFFFVVVIKYRLRSREPTVISPNINYLNSSDLIDTMDGWEKDRDKIKLLEPLGKGSFGMVYKGIATGIDNDYPDEEMWVAVKTVNDRASFFDRREFLKEATTMKAFDCYHVVKLLGVVSIGQPALVIMELMATDLKNYLREHRPDELQPGVQPPRIKDILQMAGEIADGMAYLADKKFVHRDLAARNCMVAEDATVKIGDFGMARDIYETDYYRKGGRGMLPVRWMSPESLRDGVFTSLSDVWSFGVVLWEMVTLAAQPYQGLSNEEVVKYVSDKNTMAVPEECPHEIEALMKRCWQKQRERPTFLQIIQSLEPHLNEKFRKLSFYFSSGAHLSQLGDGSGDGVGDSSSRHDLYDKGMDQGASAYLQTDLQFASESSLQSGMGEGNHDEDEFCSDNIMYKRDPSSHNGFDFPQNSGGHHPKHEGGKCVKGLGNDYNSRYSDGEEEDDGDDESDSRCLMLGGGCPTPTTTAAEPCISSSPLSASPLLSEDVNNHPHPFHHHHHHNPSHEANQGLYELQPLIAPAHNSTPPVKDNTTPISTATLSPPSSWNPQHNKSSLPSTVAMGVTSPNSNTSDHPQKVSPSYCSPVFDYLGYNPSPSQPFSLTDNNTAPGKNSSTPHSYQPSGRHLVHETENCDRVGAGVIPQQQKEQPPLSSSSSSTSSSPSSLPSSSTRGEGSDRLLWPCTESSNSSNNNSINRPSLRLPVLNQPPGGSFHQSPPNGRGDNNKNSNGDNLAVRSAGVGNAANATTTEPSSNVSDAGDRVLAENGSGRSNATNSLLKDSGNNRVAPPSQTSTSLSPSSPSSLYSRQSAPPSSSQSFHSHHPHHSQSCDTSSSEGSKESTKSSTGSNSSVPLMNGYINGHAPPPPPPPPPSSSSYPALC